jgi:hypothetical protein
MLSLESMKFEGGDLECVFEPGNGESWALWFNQFRVFMITATRGGEEFYRNIFEDLDDLMTECCYDNRVRRVVACSAVFMEPYELKEVVIYH